jgi:hypothetical protein
MLKKFGHKMQFRIKAVFIFIFLGFFEARAEGTANSAEVEYSGKQSQEWSEVQAKLAALKGKVDSQEAVVKALIAEKEHLTGTDLNAKIEQLKVENHKWQALNIEFKKLRLEYETKFPEKGLKGSRIYKRIDPQSVEVVDDDLSFDGRLQSLHKKIIQQYPATAKQIEQEKEAKKKAEILKRKPKKMLKEKKTTQIESTDLKKLKKEDDITEQIILQK